MKGLEDFGYKKPPKQQEKGLATSQEKKVGYCSEKGKGREDVFSSLFFFYWRLERVFLIR